MESREMVGIRTPDEEDDLRALEELFWTLDLGPRHRVELLDGRIEVSPKPAYWHEQAVIWLIRGFEPVCQENGWDPTPGADVPLPPDGDIIEPDYIIARDPDAIPDERSVVPPDQALLVAEIRSPSSIRQDREVKPLKCARAGIPLYLLVGRFDQPEDDHADVRAWRAGLQKDRDGARGSRRGNAGGARAVRHHDRCLDAPRVPIGRTQARGLASRSDLA